MRSSILATFALALGCGARTELGSPVELDAGIDAAPEAGIDAAPHDASPDAIAEAGPDAPPEASVPCDFGTIVADVFGSTVFWNGGAPLPPGDYRITYVDGCMKYSSGQGWTVNAYANGPDTLWIVTQPNQPLAPAPGTVGFLQGQGGYASFDDCVNANVAQDVAFEIEGWTGAPLGLQLADNPYTDNVPGENGRSPTYRLSSCP